jgi:hypothetical protein
MTAAQAMALLDEAKRLKYKFTDWQEIFVRSISMKSPMSNLSLKQQKVVEGIYEKASKGGIYQNREVIKWA